jgi:hypothetical protein
VTRIFDDQPSLVHRARYKTLSHKKAEPNPDRKKIYSRKDHFVSKLMGFPIFNTGDPICNSKPFILTFLWISRKIYS